MKVLVIIVSYNFERWIDRCLGSLRQSKYPVNVVVIDNASQDHTLQCIRNNYPEVRLIESKTNLGFGRANNLGMKIAVEESYEAVFLLNQDAWISSDVIGTLVDLLQQNPEYGILSPVHLTEKGDKTDPGFSFYTGIERQEQQSEDIPICCVPFLNAAFWMIPTTVLKQIGGFCPLFYHYGEDKDFVNRLHFQHYKLGYCPTIFGHHDREYRPVTPTGFLHTESVYHLSELANVHYNGFQAFAYGVLAVAKKTLQNFFSGKFSLCLDYLNMTFKLCMRYREASSYRKKNRISNPHYIQ